MDHFCVDLVKTDEIPDIFKRIKVQKIKDSHGVYLQWTVDMLRFMFSKETRNILVAKILIK